MKIYLILFNLGILYSSFLKKRFKLGRRKKQSHKYINKRDLKNISQEEEHIYAEINENLLTCDGHLHKDKYLTLCVETDNLCNSCSDVISCSSVCSMCGKYYLNTKGHAFNNKVFSNQIFPNSRLNNDPAIDEDGYLKPIKKEGIEVNLKYIDLDFSYDKYESTRLLNEKKIVFLLEELAETLKICGQTFYLNDNLINVVLEIEKSIRKYFKKGTENLIEKSADLHGFVDLKKQDKEESKSFQSIYQRSIVEIERNIHQTKDLLKDLILQLNELSVSKENDDEQSESFYENLKVSKRTSVDKQFLPNNSDLKENDDDDLKLFVSLEKAVQNPLYEKNLTVVYDNEGHMDKNSSIDKEDNLRNKNQGNFTEISDLEKTRPKNSENKNQDNSPESIDLKTIDELNSQVDNQSSSCRPLSFEICNQVNNQKKNKKNIISPFGLETIEEASEEDFQSVEKSELTFQETSTDSSLLKAKNDKENFKKSDKFFESRGGITKLQDLKDLVFKKFQITEKDFNVFCKFFKREFKLERSKQIELLYYTSFLVIQEILQHFSRYKLPQYFFNEFKGRSIIESKDIYKYDELFLKVLCKDILDALKQPELLGRKYSVAHCQFRKVIVFFKHLLKITKRTKDPLLNNMKTIFKNFILKNKTICGLQILFENNDLLEEIVVSLLKTMRSFK